MDFKFYHMLYHIHEKYYALTFILQNTYNIIIFRTLRNTLRTFIAKPPHPYEKLILRSPDSLTNHIMRQITLSECTYLVASSLPNKSHRLFITI